MTSITMTDGSPVTSDHREIDPATGQQKGYVVLSAEERAKGFVRPLRQSYVHVGDKPQHPTRPLSAEEQERYADSNFVAFEIYPLSEAPMVGKFWTAQEMHGCGVTTTMARSIAETYARNPKFYGGTFCTGCGKHLPVAQFRWAGTDEAVGS